MIDTLTFDPGAAAGLAAGDSSRGLIVYSGRIVETTSSWKGGGTGRDRTGEYLARLRGAVFRLVARGLNLKTATIACEAAFVGRFPGSGLSLAKRIGMFKAVVGRGVVEIPNAQWKAELGLPNGGKEDIAAYKAFALTLPGVDPSTTWTSAGDEASAACICAHVMRRKRAGLPVLMTQAEINAATKRREKARLSRMPDGWRMVGDAWTSVTGGFVLTERDGWWTCTVLATASRASR